MGTKAKGSPSWQGSLGRKILWGLLGTFWILPLIAMAFTDEVDWDALDFVVAGGLLGGTGLLFEFVARRHHDLLYRMAAGVSLAAVLMLIWANLAVGLIGSEGHPANLLYLVVIATGLLGAWKVRLKARGMARVLYLMAFLQGVIAIAAIAAQWAYPVNDAWDLMRGHGFFVLLFVGAGWLFQRAALSDAASLGNSSPLSPQRS